MKKWICSCAVLLYSWIASAQNITAAEYFFDTDPGVGNGTPVAVGTPGATVNFNAVIPAGLLSNGFHILAIRTRDANSVWSLFETRAFYVSNTAGNMPAINAAEYFIDNDPGIGNGTALNVGSAGNTVNFVAALPTTSLVPGFHLLAIRTRNVNGLWGLFETRPFYISASAANMGAITAAEYFIDNDPGAGNGTAVTVGASGNTVNFTASFPVAALSNGFHNLAIRTRDVNGIWSLFEHRLFYINAAGGNMAALVGGEAFLDTDPGIGNGQPFTFGSPGSTISQIVSMNIPAGTTVGQHLLVARVKDANGVWSLFDTVRTLNVTPSVPLPLRFLRFEARKWSHLVMLNWETAEEVNTSHFEIERSKNGLSFTKIGQVAAVNSPGQHTYTFKDERPESGINYYRLRQVDKDGRASFSNVVKLLFNAYGDELVVFPNPAKQQLQLRTGGFTGTVRIQVFDAKGTQVINENMPVQAVQTLYVGKLAAGRYTVLVWDGLKTASAGFIKE